MPKGYPQTEEVYEKYLDGEILLPYLSDTALALDNERARNAEQELLDKQFLEEAERTNFRNLKRSI